MHLSLTILNTPINMFEIYKFSIYKYEYKYEYEENKGQRLIVCLYTCH